MTVHIFGSSDTENGSGRCCSRTSVRGVPDFVCNVPASLNPKATCISGCDLSVNGERWVSSLELVPVVVRSSLLMHCNFSVEEDAAYVSVVTVTWCTEL
jgi:hypothetical protein